MSSKLKFQSLSSFSSGVTSGTHVEGSERTLFEGLSQGPDNQPTTSDHELQEITLNDNPTHLSLSGIQDGIIKGAEVRLRTQEPKILPGDQTKTLRNEDIIVVLIGPSTTGKSSFVNTVMGKDVAKVGNDYESCTQQVRAYGCMHPDGSGRKVVVVDTPGFDDTYRFDFDVLRDLAKWLAKTYRKRITLSGILHFHNIEESRMRGSSIRSLQMFQALCGENALCNVVLTTTHWDSVSSDIGASRESQLRLKFWKLFIDQGSRVARFQPRTYEAAWNLIDLFSAPLNASTAAPKARQPLQIQTELVTEGKPLHQSSAYVFLAGWWTNLTYRLKQVLGSKADRVKRAEKQKKRFKYRNNTPGSPLGSGFFGQTQPVTSVTNLDSVNVKDTNINDEFNDNSRSTCATSASLFEICDDQRRKMSGLDQEMDHGSPQSTSGPLETDQFKEPIQVSFPPLLPTKETSIPEIPPDPLCHEIPLYPLAYFEHIPEVAPSPVVHDIDLFSVEHLTGGIPDATELGAQINLELHAVNTQDD